MQCASYYCTVPLGTTLDQYANFAANVAVLYPQSQPGYRAAAQAQYNYIVGLLTQMGANREQLEAFQKANSNLFSLGVEGGNVHFNNPTIGKDEYGNPIPLFNFGRDNGRCYNGLDFSHDQGRTFHGDTADALDFFGGGTLKHAWVDVFLGNFWYLVIPR